MSTGIPANILGISGQVVNTIKQQDSGEIVVTCNRDKRTKVIDPVSKLKTSINLYSHAVNGDWAQTKAYYRMIDKPQDSAFSMENIWLYMKANSQRCIHPSDKKYNEALEKRQKIAQEMDRFVNPIFFQARLRFDPFKMQ